jgi:3-hydroxybutyrate dehydrogenase
VRTAELSPDLSGRTALVTGAASGIGLAIAQDLSRRRAAVILSSQPDERLERAAAELPGSRIIGADLTVREDVHRLAREAGQVDILINNAGFQHVSPVDELDEAKWDEMMAVMLTAPFLLIRQLITGMYDRSWGRIINIASVHGVVASPYKSAYVAAKHGIVGLTKTVALEAAARASGVSAHAICPSYVRTPLVEKQITGQARVHGIPEHEVLERIMLTRNAIKRLIEPKDVAEVVAFLCREEAWSMTGSVLTMDAGWLAH